MSLEDYCATCGAHYNSPHKHNCPQHDGPDDVAVELEALRDTVETIAEALA